MNKVIFGTALASMALLSACSSDNELANVETSANNAIGFHVVGNKAETRTTIVDNSNITGTNFNVFAFTEDGKHSWAAQTLAKKVSIFHSPESKKRKMGLYKSIRSSLLARDNYSFELLCCQPRHHYK